MPSVNLEASCPGYCTYHTEVRYHIWACILLAVMSVSACQSSLVREGTEEWSFEGLTSGEDCWDGVKELQIRLQVVSLVQNP